MPFLWALSSSSSTPSKREQGVAVRRRVLRDACYADTCCVDTAVHEQPNARSWGSTVNISYYDILFDPTQKCLRARSSPSGIGCTRSRNCETKLLSHCYPTAADASARKHRGVGLPHALSTAAASGDNVATLPVSGLFDNPRTIVRVLSSAP